MFKRTDGSIESSVVLWDDTVFSNFLYIILFSFIIKASYKNLIRYTFCGILSIAHTYQFLCICWRVKMSLFDSFKDVYEKVFTTSSVNTDNLIFKLHYRVTVTALVIFSVVLSLGQVRFIYCSIHMPRIFFCLGHLFLFAPQ